ncbi:Hypothetical predicted protein [Octopus vulgaris]|uniref:Uncharacterized protein n=1 Tax=Octopus vulgaris TaxID=6645 RepID=A0AA36AZ64_OCTVU|nr:Hypothetical predicted protein [Octopus vulgaris]
MCGMLWNIIKNSQEIRLIRKSVSDVYFVCDFPRSNKRQKPSRMGSIIAGGGDDEVAALVGCGFAALVVDVVTGGGNDAAEAAEAAEVAEAATCDVVVVTTAADGGVTTLVFVLFPDSVNSTEPCDLHWYCLLP